MARNSTIEWTHGTWNPVTGCTKISAGCDHCYAERFSERFRGVKGHPYEVGFDLTLRPERLDQPKHWRRPQLIFVNSMSDLFHKDIPAEYIDCVFDTMENADWHIYQVLTKRSSLMRDFINRRYSDSPVPKHIWLGVSIESALKLSRLHHLKQTNASVRFVSFEPLLGSLGSLNFEGVHWVIAGGESGPGARPVQVEWLRELRSQCLEQKTAFFFKQWGGRTPKAGGNILDGRQWLEYPDIGYAQALSEPLQAAGAPVNELDEFLDVGSWAKEKLRCLSKYLNAYTTILRKRSFKGYFYVDAFAGPGTLKIRKKQAKNDSSQLLLINLSENIAGDPGETEYISGSPRIALDIRHPFTDYVFVEVDKKRLTQLRKLKAEYENEAPKRRIHIRAEDCNNYLCELLNRNQRYWDQWRGVIFLDPFGMQVPWKTIADIGKTQAIEIFINFPVGMSIQRLLLRKRKFSEEEREKLDQYFGTDEWFDVIYKRRKDMFGNQTSKIQKSGDVLVKWYCERLKEVFGYVSSAREICSTQGRPLYYLIFAGPNQTGLRIANEILQQEARIVK